MLIVFCSIPSAAVVVSVLQQILALNPPLLCCVVLCTHYAFTGACEAFRNLWQVQFKIKLFNYFQRATRVLFPSSGHSNSYGRVPHRKHLQFKCQSKRNLPQGFVECHAQCPWLPTPSHRTLIFAFAFLIDFTKVFATRETRIVNIMQTRKRQTDSAKGAMKKGGAAPQGMQQINCGMWRVHVSTQ